jgi:hypothetical protein
MLIKNYILLFIFTFSSIFVNAQVNFKKNRIGYLASIGSATYIGDLSNSVHDLTFKPNIGLGLSYRLNHAFSIRGEIDYFRLGADKSTKNNSISFKSNNAELSAIMMYEIGAKKRSFANRKYLLPYFFAGVGLTTFSVKVNKSGDPDFRTINQSSYSGTTPVIPFGLGLKIKANKATDILLEVGYRKTFTKNLDNIRPQISDPAPVNTDPASHPNAKINQGTTDGYFIANIKVLYSPKHLFRKKIKSANSGSNQASQKNKKTSKQIARNKKLASDKVIKSLSIR